MSNEVTECTGLEMFRIYAAKIWFLGIGSAVPDLLDCGDEWIDLLINKLSGDHGDFCTACICS